MKLASLFCSQECPEIEHLRFSVIYGRSGFVNCVTIGEIRNNLGADTLDSFDVFLSDLPGDITLSAKLSSKRVNTVRSGFSIGGLGCLLTTPSHAQRRTVCTASAISCDCACMPRRGEWRAPRPCCIASVPTCLLLRGRHR